MSISRSIVFARDDFPNVYRPHRMSSRSPPPRPALQHPLPERPRPSWAEPRRKFETYRPNNLYDSYRPRPSYHPDNHRHYSPRHFNHYSPRAPLSPLNGPSRSRYYHDRRLPRDDSRSRSRSTSPRRYRSLERSPSIKPRSRSRPRSLRSRIRSRSPSLRSRIRSRSRSTDRSRSRSPRPSLRSRIRSVSRSRSRARIKSVSRSRSRTRIRSVSRARMRRRSSSSRSRRYSSRGYRHYSYSRSRSRSRSSSSRGRKQRPRQVSTPRSLLSSSRSSIASSRASNDRAFCSSTHDTTVLLPISDDIPVVVLPPPEDRLSPSSSQALQALQSLQTPQTEHSALPPQLLSPFSPVTHLEDDSHHLLFQSSTEDVIRPSPLSPSPVSSPIGSPVQMDLELQHSSPVIILDENPTDVLFTTEQACSWSDNAIRSPSPPPLPPLPSPSPPPILEPETPPRATTPPLKATTPPVPKATTPILDIPEKVTTPPEPKATTPVPPKTVPPPLVPLPEPKEFRITDIANAKNTTQVLRRAVMTRYFSDRQTREERVDPVLTSNLSLSLDQHQHRPSSSVQQLVDEVCSGHRHLDRLAAFTTGFRTVLANQFSEREAERVAKIQKLRKDYAALHEKWVNHCALLDQQSRALQSEVDVVQPAGRTTRRSAATMGDAVRSDLEMEQIIASLGNDEATDPAHLSLKNLATIPDMISVTHGRVDYVYDNTNHRVHDPGAYYGPRIHDWTEHEKQIFLDKFAEYPKQFGLISDSLPDKSARDCVVFYYLHKKSIDFRKIVSQYAPNKRKRRGGGRKKGIIADIQQHDAEVSSGTRLLAVPGRGSRGGRRGGGRRAAIIQRKEVTPLSTPTPEPQESASGKGRRKRGGVENTDEPVVASVDSRPAKRAKRSRKTIKSASIVVEEPVEEVWCEADKSLFLSLLAQYGDEFERIAASLPNKTVMQVEEFYKNNVVQVVAAEDTNVLAENQRPMYAIPTEGWLNKPPGLTHQVEDANQTMSMMFKPRRTSCPTTGTLKLPDLPKIPSLLPNKSVRRIVDRLESPWPHLSSSSSSSSQRLRLFNPSDSVRLLDADVPTSACRTRMSRLSAPVSPLPPLSRSSSSSPPLVVSSRVVPPLCPITSPQPPSHSQPPPPQPPPRTLSSSPPLVMSSRVVPPSPQPPPQEVMSSRRRIMSVAALTGADDVCHPPYPASTTVLPSQFYS